VIYSRWRPEGGGYDYFEDASLPNLNDDLPNPDKVRMAGEIGVPSVECGRSIPESASWAGEGEVARGVIAPIDPSRIMVRSRIGGLGGAQPSSKIVDFGLAFGVTLLAIVVAVEWKWHPKTR